MANAEWSTTQDEDPVLREVKHSIQSNSWTRPEDPLVRKYWYRRHSMRVDDSVLVKTTQSSLTGTTITQIVVPTRDRHKVLEMAHDHPTSGHLGVRRTFERLRRRFYWLNMEQDVEEWCRACRDCSTRKPPHQHSRAPLVSMPEAKKPFEMIALDIVGPLKRTRRGNRYILVISDYFTRWPEAVALPNQEAETIASALVELVVSRFGVPLIILTDQGRNFESNLFSSLCKSLGVQKCRTSAYHPQCDGLVERLNRTLVTQLSMYTASNQEDWDEWLPHCLLAYRTSVHDSTGLPPASLLLTFDPSVPLDLMREYASDESSSHPSDPLSYAEVVRKNIKDAFQRATENSSRAKSRQATVYDRKGVHGSFDIGNRVWLFNPATPKGLSSKLRHHWTGPFTIVDKPSSVTYKIQGDGQKHTSIVHHNRLKHCFSPPASRPPRLSSKPPSPKFTVSGQTDIDNQPSLLGVPEVHHVLNCPSAPYQDPSSGVELQPPANSQQRPGRSRRPPVRYGSPVFY